MYLLVTISYITGLLIKFVTAKTSQQQFSLKNYTFKFIKFYFCLSLVVIIFATIFHLDEVFLMFHAFHIKLLSIIFEIIPKPIYAGVGVGDIKNSYFSTGSPSNNLPSGFGSNNPVSNTGINTSQDNLDVDYSKKISVPMFDTSSLDNLMKQLKENRDSFQEWRIKEIEQNIMDNVTELENYNTNKSDEFSKKYADMFSSIQSSVTNTDTSTSTILKLSKAIDIIDINDNMTKSKTDSIDTSLELLKSDPVKF